MTYIPKSQISIKIAGEGEFQYQSSRKPFVGRYIETSKGIRHAGANNMNIGPIIIPVETISDKKHGFSRDVRKFDIIKDSIKKFTSNTQPIPSMKRYPSKSDYYKGVFTRYFSRRINSTGYQEIDKDVYDSIVKKDKKYDHNLYEVGSIRWSLKGNVFKDNALTLQEVERIFKNISNLFPIFNEFAKSPFQNQENLWTEGGELWRADSTEYIGSYHVHNTMGPMEGAYHTETEHPKLYYINELPTPSGMPYEEFLAGYPPIDVVGEIPIREDVSPRDIITPVNPPDPPVESFNCMVSWGEPPTSWTGEVSPTGLIPVAGACVDPGDGTGLYLAVSGGDISATALENCQRWCEGTPLVATEGVGCLFEWDSNYCSICSIMDLAACSDSYMYSGGGYPLPPDSCPCGMYNGHMYYAISCC